MKIILFLLISLISIGGFAQTQQDLNKEAHDSYLKADKELNQVYQKLQTIYKEDTAFIKNLKASQRIWITFRDAELKMKYPDREPGYYGSIHPLCQASYLEYLTRERSRTLQLWVDGMTEEDECGGSVRAAEPGSQGEDREPGHAENREFGRIIRIEDGAYPMFVVTVEFPERHYQVDFDLNAETIGLDAAKLNALRGKYAVIYYLSELENNMFDIHYKGKSLLGEYAPEKDQSWKVLTGKLGRCTTATAGDLPDLVTVTDKEGMEVAFDYFITPEMVAVNGKEVTVYYDSSGVQKITYLRAVKE